MSPIVKKVVGLVIVVLVASNIYFVASAISLKRELNRVNHIILQDSQNEKVVYFMQMFINDVLKSDEEVGFEARLKLENAVRETNDKEILESWQDFINSSDEIIAQENVKNLFSVLASKIAGK